MTDTKEEVAKPAGVELTVEKIKYDMSQDRYSGCLGRSRRAVAYLLEEAESLQEEVKRLKAGLSKVANCARSVNSKANMQSFARAALKEGSR